MTMISGNGYDSAVTRQERNRAREQEGQCTFCPPHRGENMTSQSQRYWEPSPASRRGRWAPHEPKHKK